MKRKVLERGSGIAYLKGYITTKKLLKITDELKKTYYGQYLFNIAKDD